MAWYPKIFALKNKGGRGTELPFPSGRCSIGGDASCDVRIRGAGLTHCLLIVDMNKQAHVVNVSGTKDVLKNDEHVPNEAFLNHGDIVTVGFRQFRFEWVSKKKKKEGMHSSPFTNEGARESSTSKAHGSEEGLAAQQMKGPENKEDVATQQSLKVSSTKRTSVPKKVKEAPERETLDTSLPAQVRAGNLYVSQGNASGFGGSSTSMNATAGDPEYVDSPTKLNASRSQRTPALKKVNEETPKQNMSGTRKSVNVGGTKKGTPAASYVNEKEQGAASMSLFKDESSNGTFFFNGRAYGMDPQQITADKTNGETVADEEAALEKSFGSRSTRYSCTPISNVTHLDTPEQVAVGRRNSSSVSKVKQSPALKRASRGGQKHDSGADTSVAFNTSGPKETVHSGEVEDFEQQAVWASPSNHLTLECSDVAVGKSAKTRRSTRMPDAMNISAGKSTPAKSTNQEKSTSAVCQNFRSKANTRIKEVAEK
ncbi:hypothetical protein MRX96_041479 [Rhipicephalus microplus]